MAKGKSSGGLLRTRSWRRKLLAEGLAEGQGFETAVWVPVANSCHHPACFCSETSVSSLMLSTLAIGPTKTPCEFHVNKVCPHDT
jgi:hypothetical protein